MNEEMMKNNFGQNINISKCHLNQEIYDSIINPIKDIRNISFKFSDIIETKLCGFDSRILRRIDEIETHPRRKYEKERSLLLLEIIDLKRKFELSDNSFRELVNISAEALRSLQVFNAKGFSIEKLHEILNYLEKYYIESNRILDVDMFVSRYGFNPLLLANINDLELSVRSHNALRYNGYIYIGQILKKKPHELLKLPNFGRKSLNELIEEINRYGLNFYGRDYIPGNIIAKFPNDISNIEDIRICVADILYDLCYYRHTNKDQIS